MSQAAVATHTDEYFARSAAAVDPDDPRVYGESPYDRVTSMLMAVVIGAAVVVGWLYLIYLTNEGLRTRVTSPLQIVEVFGGGGGSPDGAVGATEKIDVPGAAAAKAASNNDADADASDFEEPSVRATPAAMIDAVAEAGAGLAEVDVEAVMPNGGPVASGKRASKLGTGGPGLGFGAGDGGVPAEQRWSIIYHNGESPEEYARQLDALGVELAVVSGPNQLTYIARFSDAAPAKRYGSGQGDDRLYFLWQGRGRKASDVALLRKAGIEVGDGVVMQFYAKGVETQLSQLEVRFRGRQPLEIRFTRFAVVPADGGGYTFKVVAQEPLR